ncbi:MAG: TolC family protein, partial [Cyclobacteriaceae bacterium]
MMKKINMLYERSWILLGAWVLLSPIAQAQNTAEVTEIPSLEEAWQYALKNNPDWEVYQLQQEKALSELKTSRSILFPTISGTFSG